MLLSPDELLLEELELLLDDELLELELDDELELLELEESVHPSKSSFPSHAVNGNNNSTTINIEKVLEILITNNWIYPELCG